MHFFNPVPLMELLEIIEHDLVSGETLEKAKEIGSVVYTAFCDDRTGGVLGDLTVMKFE